MTIESTTRAFVKTVLGIVVVGASLYWGWVFIHQKPIDNTLVKIAAGGVVFGGILIDPDAMLDAGKRIVSLIGSLTTALKGGGSPPAP